MANMIRHFKFRIVWRRRRLKPKTRLRVKLRRAREYLAHKEAARKLVHERLEHFNQFYGFTYKKVAIRNQKTRWGSCSKQGNLNFSYRLALMPAHHADYIIVHELCHLGEFNHSPAFWALVEKTVLDYRELRKQLKRAGLN